MRYGTACSGVEAPTQAWEIFDNWTPVFFSEIEPFPSEVLRTRWPHVPNLGDMTAPEFLDRINALGGLDLFCAGTPCQGFSLAGMRGGLADDRSNLCLRFVQLVHGIKSDEKDGVRYCLWENVVGVLSDETNAFGNMLAGLVGAEQPLVPCELSDPIARRYWKPDKRSGRWRCSWPHSGFVVGPRRTAAWRVLDAQGFVPQRRERVFLFSCRTADRVNPAAVLLEPEADPALCFTESRGPSLFPVPQGLPGNLDASRSSKTAVAALTASRFGAGGADDNAAQQGHIMPCRRDGMTAFGRNNTAGPINEAACLMAHGRSCGRLDFETETFVVQPAIDVRHGTLSDVAHPIQAHGGGEAGYSLHSTPCALVVFDSKQDGRDAGEIAPTLRAMGHDKSHANGGGQLAVVIAPADGDPIPFDTTQITSPHNYSHPKPGHPCHPLAATAHPPAVAYGVRTSNTGANGIGVQENMAHALDTTGNQAVAAPAAECSPVEPREMVVRRLTPVECERLMGFADDFTLIPFLGKPQVTDNHRYKACGNSMVTFVMWWLAFRIDQFHKIVTGSWT